MRKHGEFLVPAVLAGVAIVGCYTGADVDPNRPPVAARSSDGTEPASTTGADLPCDVAKLLSEKCASCHGATLSGGAPNRMLGYDDLAAPSASDPDTSVAKLSVARMKSAQRPMPPDAPLTDAEVEILARWIDAGMPKGTCSASGAADTPTVCTSGTRWTRGDRGSENMHPGVACIACHRKEGEGPLYAIAGTLYPTAHEPDDCNGTSSNAVIVITDATGKEIRLKATAAGNFFSRTRFTPPYTAKVIRDGKTRAMEKPQTDGDCNTCHTLEGTKEAPGRIFLP